MRSLSLSGGKFTQKTFSVVGETCPDLLDLDLSGCFHVTDSELRQLLQRCQQLNVLRVQNCRKLTDDAVDVINECGTQVHSLDIGGNYNMTDAGVVKLLQSHPNAAHFRALSISGLPCTDETVRMVATACPNLEDLGVAYSDAEEASLLDVAARLPRLRRLDVSWCSKLTINFATQVGATCTQLDELNICGVRPVNLPTLTTLVEQRAYQAAVLPDSWRAFRVINAKFTLVGKGTADNLAKSYADLQIIH